MSLEDKSCLCGVIGEDRILFSASDTLHGMPGFFSVVKCQSCGLIRTNPRPDPTSIGCYYPDNYGPYLGTRVRESNFFRKMLKWIYANLFSTHSQDCPPVRRGLALEVGCASGSYLSMLAKEGWQVEGIEFSPKASFYAREAGFQVYTGSLEQIELDAAKKYDLIVGWMVFEHLHDPILALAKFHDWLADDGFLVLSMPDSSGGDFDTFKQFGYALQVPTHLYHFTPDSVGDLLSRHGWRVEKVIYHRTLANWIAGLGIWLEARSRFPGLAKYLKSYPERFDLVTIIFHPLAVLMAALGKTGRMTVWVRKVNIL